MIIPLLFYLHIVAVVAVFTKRWQESGWIEGILAVSFIVLFFSVGWSLTMFILKLIMDTKGFGLWLDRDTLSLVLLTVAELVFYCIYVKKNRRIL